MTSRTLKARRRKPFSLRFTGKESSLISRYRKLLGLDRFETEDVLHKHNVTEDLGTLEDYLSDARTLEALRASGR